jgi:hypothetical protein
MSLDETKCLRVEIVTDTPQVDTNFASILFIPLKKFRNRSNPLFGKIDAVLSHLARLGFDQKIRLKSLDKASQRLLSGDRPLIAFFVPWRHSFEKRDDEIESPSPQSRIHLEHALKIVPVSLFDKEGETEWAEPDFRCFHEFLPSLFFEFFVLY